VNKYRVKYPQGSDHLCFCRKSCSISSFCFFFSKLFFLSLDIYLFDFLLFFFNNCKRTVGILSAKFPSAVLFDVTSWLTNFNGIFSYSMFPSPFFKLVVEISFGVFNQGRSLPPTHPIVSHQSNKTKKNNSFGQYF